MKNRIFFSTDVHGSTAVWQKWIKAKEVYDADVLMLCGDLTGKALVPLVKSENNTYRAFYFGKKWIFNSKDEISEFKKKLENIGVYSVKMTGDEFEELKSDNGKVERLMKTQITERIENWLSLLISVTKMSEVKIIVMPGNDDYFEVDPIIQSYENKGVIFPLDKIVKLNGIEIVSLAHVNPTPWDTPREVEEKALEKMIKKSVEKLKDPNKSVFNFHAPPYKTKLDLAPQIGKNKKPVIKGGQIKLIHVGSKAVRNAIEKYHPLLGLHGHIHESSGVERIGKTLALNPGSEYSEAVLRGFIIETIDQSISNYWRVEC